MMDAFWAFLWQWASGIDQTTWVVAGAGGFLLAHLGHAMKTFSAKVMSFGLTDDSEDTAAGMTGMITVVGGLGAGLGFPFVQAFGDKPSSAALISLIGIITYAAGYYLIMVPGLMIRFTKWLDGEYAKSQARDAERRRQAEEERQRRPDVVIKRCQQGIKRGLEILKRSNDDTAAYIARTDSYIARLKEALDLKEQLEQCDVTMPLDTAIRRADSLFAEANLQEGAKAFVEAFSREHSDMQRLYANIKVFVEAIVLLCDNLWMISGNSVASSDPEKAQQLRHFVDNLKLDEGLRPGSPLMQELVSGRLEDRLEGLLRQPAVRPHQPASSPQPVPGAVRTR